MPMVPDLAHEGRHHAGEVGAVLGVRLEVGGQPRGEPVLESADDHRLGAGLLRELRPHRVVAAGPEDDPLGPAVHQLPVHGGDVPVTGSVGDLELRADLGRDGLGRLDPLLVPAEVVGLLRSDDGYLGRYLPGARGGRGPIGTCARRGGGVLRPVRAAPGQDAERHHEKRCGQEDRRRRHSLPRAGERKQPPARHDASVGARGPSGQCGPPGSSKTFTNV